MTKALPQPRTIGSAIVAGSVAGTLILAFLVASNLTVLRTPGFSLAGLFQFDAAILIGKTAFAGGASVALGAVLHYVVSIIWAGSYALLAERQPQLVTRPIVSGAAFGLLVWFSMQVLIIAAGLFRVPTPLEVGISLVAHLAFFGIPIALVVGRLNGAR
jgi:hypothetical protein